MDRFIDWNLLMILSFLKQYQSPTAVLMQWWCLFAARHPRTALALKVMGLYLILAAVTDPVVHADEGKENSGGGDAFTMFLDTSNLKDKEGIEINRYSTLPLDRGDAFTYNKTIIGNILDFMWGVHYRIVSLSLAILHYVLSFEWLDWLLSPFMFIGAQVAPLMERMGIHPLILTLAAAVFSVAFFMMRRRGAALAELSIILGIVSLISGSALANPTAQLRDHKGPDGTQQTGWLLNSTTWASDVASEIYLHDKKRQQVEASGMSQGLANQKPQDIITRSLVSVLVREPYQLVAFGQNLDGKCKTDFNNMVREKDYKDTASNERRDAITSSSGCSDTKKWVDNPDLYRAGDLLSYTLSALAPLFLVAVFIVLIFKTVFDACVNAVLTTVYAWYAMLPAVDRRKFFDRAIGTFFSCLKVGVLIGVLVLYLYILEQFYDATAKWAPLLRSIVMATLIFILAKKSWEFFRDRNFDGSGLAERLSRMGLKGSSGAGAAVRFTNVPSAFSPHAVSASSIGGGSGSGAGGAVSTMGGARSAAGAAGKLLAPINSFRAKRQPAYADSGVPQNHAAMREYMGPATKKHYRSARNLSRKGRALKFAGTAVALVPGGLAPGIGMRLTGAAMQHRGQHRMRKVESEYAYPTFSIYDRLGQSEEELRRRKDQEEQAEREQKEQEEQEQREQKEQKKKEKKRKKDRKKKKEDEKKD